MSESATPETGTGEISLSEAAKHFEGLLGSETDTPASEGEAVAEPDTEAAMQPAEGEGQVEEQASEGGGEGEAEPAGQQPETYEVTLAGGEKSKVTLDELKKGYSRESDYTRKTMAHAESVKAWEGEKAQHVEAFKAALGTLQAELTAVLGDESKVDWESLRQTNLAEYTRLREYFQGLKEKRAAVHQEWLGVQRIEAQKANERLVQTLETEGAKLREKMPLFADTAKAESAKADLRTYLASAGFSPEEIGGMHDHRQVIVAWKAAQYDKLQSRKPEVDKRLVKLPPVQKPGAAAEPGQISHQKRTALTAKLQKTGSVKDAAALFMDFV